MDLTATVVMSRESERERSREREREENKERIIRKEREQQGGRSERERESLRTLSQSQVATLLVVLWFSSFLTRLAQVTL